MDNESESLYCRQFLSTLAVAGAATVAGCGHPSVVLDMDAATADAIAVRETRAKETGHLVR